MIFLRIIFMFDDRSCLCWQEEAMKNQGQDCGHVARDVILRVSWFPSHYIDFWLSSISSTITCVEMQLSEVLISVKSLIGQLKEALVSVLVSLVITTLVIFQNVSCFMLTGSSDEEWGTWLRTCCTRCHFACKLVPHPIYQFVNQQAASQKHHLCILYFIWFVPLHALIYLFCGTSDHVP